MCALVEDEAVALERLSRRDLLLGGTAGAVAATVAAPGVADAARGYPRLRVIELSRLKRNRPVRFDYPLKGQANILLDLGHRVPGGAGPKRSIVAYSVLCQHMGCGLGYRPNGREFVCPCHQSRYDPERLGSVIQGVAMRALPRVVLRVRRGAVWAVGVDGLIYGYRSNLTPGKRVGGRK